MLLDNNCPRTMMILGAALSGGDAIEMARRLAGQHDAGPRAQRVRYDVIKETTGRGFKLVSHEKYSNHSGATMSRLVQESSAIGEYDDAMERPGSSYLWVGEHHHLDREQVEELIAYLQNWLDTGRLF